MSTLEWNIALTCDSTLELSLRLLGVNVERRLFLLRLLSGRGGGLVAVLCGRDLLELDLLAQTQVDQLDVASPVQQSISRKMINITTLKDT